MAIKILSMDDELDMEMLIQTRFRKQIRERRYEFIFAHNGIEALEVLEQHTDIDIVLSDINMPEMDGLTFLTKLNTINNPRVKAVMVSAHGDMDNIRKAMNLGAFDFITKPINFEDLDITIDKTVGHIEMLIQHQKERDQLVSIQNDLLIAREIQQAMLPKIFPPFPHRKDFDLHGFLEPAKSVGGDLFDFFMMDENHLFFIIGDVSDKGVPACMFMAITKAIFKTHFLHSSFENIAEEVRQVNAFLSEDNDSFMFVTAFVGVLDLMTGVVEYVDAGHEPPLILRKDGAVEVVKKKTGMALGIDPTYDYHTQVLTLQPGDTLFTYTDGVTDANNEAGDRFGMKKVEELVASIGPNNTPKEINTTVKATLKEFIGTHYQFDDITTLTLQYYGN
ncbi:PP2C family protein-serine/threonine phosphatase [Runella zeae]|jgi:sigma-B regulation protein RsbU (phosphoserine phosphatase)|uniref:PP2C family protein-serine/threonine phosphatase n=1 Tax=Runella zeae TaxID=94255 RepID=UPI000424B7D2|nr:SpoIIE family protein phosphatase [Runella zeae]